MKQCIKVITVLTLLFLLYAATKESERVKNNYYADRAAARFNAK